MKKIFAFLAAIGFETTILAENKTDINVLFTGSEDYKYKPELVDNRYYAICSEAKPCYNVVIDFDNIPSKYKDDVIVETVANGDKKTLAPSDYDLIDNQLIIENYQPFDETSLLKAGDYEFHVTVKIQNTSIGDSILIDKAAAKPITLYNPIGKMIQDEQQKQFTHIGREKSIKIQEEIGGAPNWTFTWKIDDGKENSYIEPISSLNLKEGKHTIEIIGTNTIIGEQGTKVEWFSINEQADMYVCQEPNASIYWPASHYFYKGQYINLICNPVGGTTNFEEKGEWSYQWKIDNNNIEGAQNQKYMYEVKIEDKNKTLSCDVKYTSPDGDVWLEETIKDGNTLDIYEKPTILLNNLHYNESDTGNTYAIYEGDSIDTGKFYITVGGCNNWKEALFIDDKLMPNNMLFKPLENGDYKLKIKIKNAPPVENITVENITWLDTCVTIDMKVYKKPKYTIGLENGDSLKEAVTNLELYGDLNKATFKINVEGGDPTAWEVNWDYDGVSSKGYTYDVIAVNNTENDSISRILTCQISNNPSNIIKPYSAEYRRKIFSWKKIYADLTKLVKSDDSEEWILETHEGIKSENLIVHGKGGSKNDWKFEWKDDNGKIVADSIGFISQGNITTSRINLSNLNAKQHEYKYTLNVSYSGIPKGTYPVKVIVWEEPKVNNGYLLLKEKKTNKDREPIMIMPYRNQGDGYCYYNHPKGESFECYSNDTVLMIFDVTGGKLDKEDQWVCLVGTGSNDIRKVSVTDDNKIIIPIGVKDISHSTPMVRIRNTYNGKFYTSASDNKWYTSEYYKFYSVPQSYELPIINAELNDSVGYATWGKKVVDVYAGEMNVNNIVLRHNRNTSFEKGWKYEWRVNGNTVSTEDQTWTYTPRISDKTKPFEEQTLSVHITNSIGNNYGMDTICTYPIRVWRKVEFADDFDLVNKTTNHSLSADNYGIRTGDTLTAHVNTMSYGYNPNNDDSRYNYNWAGIKTDERDWNETMKYESNTDQFGVKTVRYTHTQQNVGPYGHVWDRRTISHNVNIYNRPQTPKSLVRKGNGNSGTMICTTTVSDNDLNAHRYYLVFGYTDSNGNDHDFASQEQQDPGEVRWSKPYQSADQMSNAYVYAVWKNGDVEITSGKRTLTSTDENYDTSSYNGKTRAVIDGEWTDTDAIANINGVSSTTYRIYSINGTFVGNSKQGLKPGIYVVEYENGETNKIIIK